MALDRRANEDEILCQGPLDGSALPHLLQRRECSRLLSIETYEEVDAAIRSEGEIQAVTPSIRVASINPDL